MGLASFIYRLGLCCHRRLSRSHKLPAKVISIGNITLGGTGKTPAVISIAQEAKRRGFSPCVLTRGYRAHVTHTCFISKGNGPLISAADAGDEAYLMASLLKGVPVVKGKNRYEAGMLASKEYFGSSASPDRASGRPLPAPVFILDDGFQHWRLQRDIDIVLIDATNPFGNKKLIPEGILREPISALKRADMIILTKCDMAQEDTVTAVSQDIRAFHPDVPIVTASHRPVELTDTAGNITAFNSLVNRKIYIFSGIANSSYFAFLLRSGGANIIDMKNFRDHYAYRQKDIDKIMSDARGLDIITTEKDMVKLKGLDVPLNVRALRIEFSVDAECYENIFGRL